LQKQTIGLIAVAALAGAVGGALMSPAPAGAVAREMIQLQESVTQVLTNQQTLQTQMTQNAAVEKTLLDQVTATVSSFNSNMGTLQKSVQDLQATSGSRLDAMGTQVQGLSDNVSDLQARIGKLDQKLADAQNTLQSIDARLAGNVPAGTAEPGAPSSDAPPTPSSSAPPMAGTTNPGAPAMAPAAPSADVLYSNGLRDLTGKNYTLAIQEFNDYLKYYGTTDLASNAQFYLGEIAYSQGKFQDAVTAYSKVIENYPKSFKLAPAHLKKGLALLELNQKTNAERELRAVVRLFPGTDEERRARAKLKELGAPVA
jgi:tol-pal system protein YbgF